MRNIKPAMVDEIKKRLKNNGMAQELMAAKKDPRGLFLLANQSMVGIREEGRNNGGKLVSLISQTIGGHSFEAWCMGAQQTALAFAEEMTGFESPVFAGEHCLTVLKKTPKIYHVKSFPLAGAIVIWQHGKTTNGHTGCLESTDGKTMITYEGNTTSGLNAKGEVEREGGGFYRCQRGFKGNGSMKVVGMLIPFEKIKA